MGVANRIPYWSPISSDPSGSFVIDRVDDAWNAWSVPGSKRGGRVNVFWKPRKRPGRKVRIHHGSTYRTVPVCKKDMLDAAQNLRLLPLSVVASFLVDLRHAMGMTQQEMADRLGVSERTVRSWESVRSRPSEKTRQRIVQMVESTDFGEFSESGRMRTVRSQCSGKRGSVTGQSTKFRADDGRPEYMRMREEPLRVDLWKIRHGKGMTDDEIARRGIAMKYMRVSVAGSTQKEWASSIGVSERTVRRWESGKTRPRPSNFRKWLSQSRIARAVESASLTGFRFWMVVNAMKYSIGMSISDIALVAGVSRASLYRWCDDELPGSRHAVRRLAEFWLAHGVYPVPGAFMPCWSQAQIVAGLAWMFWRRSNPSKGHPVWSVGKRPRYVHRLTAGYAKRRWAGCA